ncbi:PKSN polyketide synthase for alternapyrone biosynthesis protein [Phlyctema vagabunda]|uniref:PKSN polyketide synthase for alternapyrone biosynthesis protein n=1 Tax=Phlyctema vagabunda TaxID=108571 RepID=A0ABR4PE43_9HELO
MYKHGARHIVFLTRSGASKTEKELQEFIDMGLKADAIKCDITSASDVSNAIQDLIQRGCQIKGLIQAAMVLEDGIFETMPFSQWNRTFQPKAAGTLNLHNALPKNMNFFIMLSSIVAIIGNAGQANYCAGNTYQDAFAKYRRNQGLAATTINVGIVSDSAHFIAENDISSYIEKYGHLASLLTTRSELEIALRAVMQGKTADGGEVPAQIVLGLSANISRDGAMADSWTKDRKFDHRITVDASSNSASAEIDTKTCLKQATSFQEALKVVETFLKGQVALDIGAAVNDVDIEKPLYDYGVDSLRAVVLRNKTFRDVGAEISVFEILSPTPIAILALRLVHRSDAVTSEIVKQAAAELS